MKKDNLPEFNCPVCRSQRYGAVRMKLPAAPYEALLYRCMQCQFGFTELEQFVKEPARQSA